MNKPVAQRYWFPEPGVVQSIDEYTQFISHPNVELLEIRVSVGDVIGPVHNHPSRAGLVITTGETLSEAQLLADHIISSISINTSTSSHA